jgi:hypothetical protein
VGTAYKQMALKPSILDEYTKERGAKGGLTPAGGFCSQDDSLVLEDEGARMVLRGDALPVQQLVTGGPLPGALGRCWGRGGATGGRGGRQGGQAGGGGGGRCAG